MRRLLHIGLWVIALASMGGVAFGAWELVAHKIEAQRAFVDPGAKYRQAY
jgi:hypothetical protein